MRRLVALAFAALATPAAAADVAECKAHLTAGLALPADRFAEDLAGAEGMAGNATPAIRSSAVMLTDLNARIRARAAERAALNDQVARVQGIAASLAQLRAKNPTSMHYLDQGAEVALNALLSDLTARVTRVGTQLDSERAALDQNLQFHCTASAPASSASAH